MKYYGIYYLIDHENEVNITEVKFSLENCDKNKQNGYRGCSIKIYFSADKGLKWSNNFNPIAIK